MDAFLRFIKDNWLFLLIAGIALFLYWHLLSAIEHMNAEQQRRLMAEAEAKKLREEKHQLQLALLEHQRRDGLWARGLEVGKAVVEVAGRLLIWQHGHA